MPTATSTDFGGARRALCRGQAMLESLAVILAVCVILFGLLQLGHAFANREILRHAAARAARARTVGFNWWMCHKVMRVAAIPNAGKMIEPAAESFPDTALRGALMRSRTPGQLWDWALTASPHSERAEFEAARIPSYLAAENDARADYILNYQDWDSITSGDLGGGAFAELGMSDSFEVSVRQKYPLTIMVKALYDWVGAMTPPLDRGELRLKGAAEIENHYPLYLDDRGL